MSIIAAIVTVGIVWAMTVSAQNAHTTSLSHNSNGATGSRAFGTAPTQYGPAPSYSAPTYSIPAPNPVVTGPAGVPRPLSSVAASNADRAYCQNRGVLLWLAEAATYRGALCSIDGTTTLVSMSRDVGGNVVLPATADQDSYYASGLSGTVYTFTKSSITILTPSKTYQESTNTWESGTSSLLTTPGDLGLNTPISYPACDESAIVVYGTSWNPATNASDVQKLLAAKPGSKYMRTDLSCRSFRGPSTNNSGGEDVYAVYAAEPSAQAACKQIAGTSYYGRVLSNQREPGDNVLNC